MSGEWRCAGLRWSVSGPSLVWRHPGRGERLSPLTAGRALAFTATGRRQCVGVRRGGRLTPCAVGAEVAEGAVSAQCAECARLDRAHSVAADTMADDPRPYDVYLAWFAPCLLKAGITAAERQGVRLLEQGALSYARLAHGPLMAARRAEAVLAAALGVPDRVPYAAKRAARAPVVPPEQRAAELHELFARARSLVPEAGERCEVVHHDEAFRLEAIRTDCGVAEPGPGRTVAGQVAAVAGPDVYVSLPDGRQVLLDARQLAGWALTAAAPDAETTMQVRRPVRAAAAPEALF
ncbi:hypothetical protein GCM10010218_59210 [Streptomyces mashuensis]|uniref:DUF2797 domain-containing protein n=1 Tax=Streptomyces mashuensis TaxID=33904 RepID=A0A919B8S9_9ACTN|nr:DUF2797 domain-containing protein [Streptomyces mashuensis]GHF70031.1 hypothetical protein GCM10010218_59210 [Streptomyces mashuensis]